MIKIMNGESWEEFCVRIMSDYSSYGLTRDDAYFKLFGKKLNPCEYRKRSYFAQDCQNAKEQERYKLFIENSEKLYSYIKTPTIEFNRKEIEDRKRVLVIGDLHAPFIKDGYFEFCKDIYKKYNCDTVVFIGDIIDCHYSSYHETDPNGFGGNEELELSKKQILKFYQEFPNAYVTLGNHDNISSRKAFSSGLSSQWIKSVGEVLETPSWKYSDSFIIDDVEYTHGTGRKARQRSRQDIINVVQGHYHSESYVENYVGKNGKRLFSMQVGCGIDEKAYAFAYGKNFASPHINVGVVINGKLALLEYMGDYYE